MNDHPTVLVVDDSPMNVRLLVRQLEKENYRLLEAENGFRAYKVAVKEQPDVILLDVMMPGKDGFEVCSILKANEKTRDIPVIFLTAKTDTVDKIRGLELGAADYITKPFAPAEVLARVRTQLRIKALHEETLRQQRALSEAQKLSSIGRLAAGIAHNFHNLLNTVMGYAELVRMKGDRDRELAEDMDRILSACRRMVGITQQLVDFAQKGEHHPSAVPTWAFLCNLIELFKAGAEDKVDVQTEVSPHLPSLWIDQSHMSEALMDLLINAYEAMPEGGTITVRADIGLLPGHLASSPPAQPGDRYVCIRITDTGVGMDEELLTTALEPFVSTKQTVGVGMGLSSAYGLIRREGGCMEVESTPGKGTTVDVYLPVGEGVRSKE